MQCRLQRLKGALLVRSAQGSGLGVQVESSGSFSAEGLPPGQQVAGQVHAELVLNCLPKRSPELPKPRCICLKSDGDSIYGLGYSTTSTELPKKQGIFLKSYKDSDNYCDLRHIP